MKYYYLLLLMFIIGSCKKSPVLTLEHFKGAWVEKTLRLDTMNFNKGSFPWSSYESNKGMVYLQSRPYDPIIMDFRNSPSDMYSYRFEGQYIYLVSMVSSFWSPTHGQTYFNLHPDKNSFTIKKFYIRNNLPDTLVFERLW